MKNKGIALLQVLLITAIISILALYFSITAREQVKLAQLAIDRAEAVVAIRSAQSELFMTLLTELRETDLNSPSKTASRWNFYNQAFTVGNNVKVSIQDQSGLFSLRFPESKLLQDIFDQNGVDSTLAPVVTDSLLDWQDADKLTRLNGAEQADYVLGPRNSNISLKNEARLVRGMSSDIWHQFANIFTLYQRGPFNPMTAPKEILAGFIGQRLALEYINKRENSVTTPRQFSAMTGLDENITQIFYPGDVLNIQMVAQRGEVTLTKTMMVELKPYESGQSSPVDYLEVRW